MVAGNTWFPILRKCRLLGWSQESILAIERGTECRYAAMTVLGAPLSKNCLPRTEPAPDGIRGSEESASEVAPLTRFPSTSAPETTALSVAMLASLARRGTRPVSISPDRYEARWRWLLIVCLLLLGSPHYADAQPATNVEAYQTMALDCLGGVPDTVRAFQLQAPPQMPYLRTALLERWQQEGRTVFLADSTLGTTPARLPRLVYLIEERGVDYERAGRRQMRRFVRLGLRYTLLGADGRLLREDACRDRFGDMVRPADQPVVETAAFPESQGEAPRAGWLRRYAQPAVLAAATAVTIYLFFSLRDNQPEG